MKKTAAFIGIFVLVLMAGAGSAEAAWYSPETRITVDPHLTIDWEDGTTVDSKELAEMLRFLPADLQGQARIIRVHNIDGLYGHQSPFSEVKSQVWSSRRIDIYAKGMSMEEFGAEVTAALEELKELNEYYDDAWSRVRAAQEAAASQ